MESRTKPHDQALGILKEYIIDQAPGHDLITENKLNFKDEEAFNHEVDGIIANFLKPKGVSLVFKTPRFAEIASKVIQHGLPNQVEGSTIKINHVTKENLLEKVTSFRGKIERTRQEIQNKIKIFQAEIAAKSHDLGSLYHVLYSLDGSIKKEWYVSNPTLWSRPRKTVSNIHEQFKKSHYSPIKSSEEKSVESLTLRQLKVKLKAVQEEDERVDTLHQAISKLVPEKNTAKQGYQQLNNAFFRSKTTTLGLQR